MCWAPSAPGAARVDCLRTCGRRHASPRAAQFQQDYQKSTDRQREARPAEGAAERIRLIFSASIARSCSALRARRLRLTESGRSRYQANPTQLAYDEDFAQSSHTAGLEFQPSSAAAHWAALDHPGLSGPSLRARPGSPPAPPGRPFCTGFKVVLEPSCSARCLSSRARTRGSAAAVNLPPRSVAACCLTEM